ncbi:MAG: ribosome recycling factor [Phycisphaeraceae bacterium]|nr:ribosome recycling factor [Phycisphaeraceae bacterium]
MDLDEIQLSAEEAMDKAVEYLKHEMRGVRTGRASTALVEFVKVDYYGSPTDLRSLALISVPEATQILIKPFDPSSMAMIVKAIQTSGLGLNPMTEGKQIRLNLPALSGERRLQLSGSIRQMGEQAKVTVRNARRDANKHVEQISKDKTQHVSEDEVEAAKEEIQEMLKRYEKQVDDLTAAKMKEIEAI